jgi:hypothetical protein
VYVLKERTAIFIEFAMSVSVRGVGRADTVARTPALSLLFSQRKRAIVLRTRFLAMAITRILRDVMGTIGHVFAYIPTVTIRLMVLATVSLSTMLAVEEVA